MKAKDIIVGKAYRVAEDSRGYNYWKGIVLANDLTREKWDRISMSYVSVPAYAKVQATNLRGDTFERKVRYQEVIEPWENFERREPERAAQYNFNREHEAWKQRRDEWLGSVLPPEYAETNSSVYLRGASWYDQTKEPTVNVTMTLSQYLAFAGTTEGEMVDSIGPEPTKKEEV